MPKKNTLTMKYAEQSLLSRYVLEDKENLEELLALAKEGKLFTQSVRERIDDPKAQSLLIAEEMFLEIHEMCEQFLAKTTGN